jgi:putative tryptophan/tyrosine transport system substrate-binding protein
VTGVKQQLRIFAKSLAFISCALLFALCSSVEAQQTKKVPRIGFLATNSSTGENNLRALRQGLRELGYIEGKNFTVEYRSGEGKLDQLAALAAELVRLKVDVIVTQGTPAAVAAKSATKTLPIIISGGTDPVATGLVPSLARPGGNITGVTIMNEELVGKQLELLKETIPKVSRLGVLWNSANPGSAVAFKQTRSAAQELSLSLQSLDVQSVNDLQGAFDAVTKNGVNGLVLLPTVPITNHVALVADLAVKNRLPSIYDRSDFVEAGGLMSYGANVSDVAHRAANYVDKVLKGANPGELPVERPTKFELVINLKTAKQIGVTIPQSVLFRADKAIK